MYSNPVLSKAVHEHMDGVKSAMAGVAVPGAAPMDGAAAVATADVGAAADGAQEGVRPPRYLDDITAGAAFQKAMKDKRFASGLSLQLGLAFDGFQPFKDDAKYSVWPMAITAFNLPPELR
jgi:hypothetical protein